MEKIKRIWNNNRVIIILCTIVISCFIISGVVMVKYFFGGNSSSYGDRLSDIADLPFKDEDKDALINKIKESKEVNEVSLKVIGKIIYVKIDFNDEASADTAKDIASKSTDSINEEYLKKYDLEYTIYKKDKEESKGFNYMGARNANRPKMIWNNNTPIKTEE